MHSVAVKAPAARADHMAGRRSARPMARASERPTPTVLEVETTGSGYHATRQAP